MTWRAVSLFLRKQRIRWMYLHALPEMDGARNSEEECPGDRCAFIWGVEPDATFHLKRYQ